MYSTRRNHRILTRAVPLSTVRSADSSAASTTDATPATLGKLSQGLWWGLHILMIGLVVLVAIRSTNATMWAGLGAFAVIYLVGLVLPQSHVVASVWFAGLVATWALMAIGGVEGAFVVFPMFFLAVYLFRPVISAVLVGLLTITVVVILGLHLNWNIGSVTGPVIGAAVAWTLGVGFQMLHAEAVAKDQALDALVHAREQALENSRRAGRADERMRLAGDIHDTVAQGLSSIHMLLGAVESQLAGADDEKLAASRESMVQQVELAKATAAENLAETRRIIAALQPAPLVGAELPVALARLASATPMGDAVSFEIDGRPYELSRQVDEAILRATQSLLSNVVRHADAERAKITLAYHPDEVSIDVVDNGVGFTVPEELAGQPHLLTGSLGLAGVYRRIDAVGGKVTVESAIGDGTGVSINIPNNQRPTNKEK